MKKLSFLAFVFVLLAASLSAKPRFVDLAAELRTASFIGEVVIDRFDSLDMHFHSTEYKDTIGVARGRGQGKIGRSFDVTYGENKLFTGAWPSIADTLLLVLDSNGRVSLFAFHSGDDYRFWSPYLTGSVAHFAFEPPARKLPDEIRPASEPVYCWDGCLLRKDLVKTYGKQ